MQKLRSGLILNVNAKPFHPLKITYPQKNVSQYEKDHHHKNNDPEFCKVLTNITNSIKRNETLQEYQHNQKLPRNDNLWIEVKKGMKINADASMHVTKT